MYDTLCEMICQIYACASSNADRASSTLFDADSKLSTALSATSYRSEPCRFSGILSKYSCSSDKTFSISDLTFSREVIMSDICLRRLLFTLIPFHPEKRKKVPKKGVRQIH